MKESSGKDHYALFSLSLRMKVRVEAENEIFSSAACVILISTLSHFHNSDIREAGLHLT